MDRKKPDCTEELKNTERFSHTVEYYSQYRPSYPKELIDYITKEKIINARSIIADIGSGTGIFTQLVLETGACVFAVEPNNAMREFAENKLRHFANFTSIDGAAEKTTLQDSSIDAISVATAFHWFDRKACKQEFKRILKLNGWVMLLWNLRLQESSPLLKEYDQLLKKYCPQYKGIPSEQITEEELISFFTKGSTEIITFENQQLLDLNGFIGRFRSSSYALTPENVGYEVAIADIKHLFNKYVKNNKVILDYTTKLYLGKLDNTG